MRTKLTMYLIAAAATTLALMSACSSNDTSTNPTTTTGDKVHGEYLVKHVMICGDCHSQHDQSGMEIDSLMLAGGNGFPIPGVGTVYTRNITPDSVYGIGQWTDDQIITAIRTGIVPVGKGGTTGADSVLFPVMPYWLYNNLTDGDVRDIVAYLRSIPAVRYQPPSDTIPAFARVQWAPQGGIPDPTTSTTQTVHGKYLLTIAGCIDCHTVPAATASNPTAQGVNMSMFLAGGRAFPWVGDPTKMVLSKNITSDSTTGIGAWSAATIDSAIAYGWDDQHRALCPPMPWGAFQGMLKTDRDDIIAYLRTVPAVSNNVPEDTTIVCPHP